MDVTQPPYAPGQPPYGAGAPPYYPGPGYAGADLPGWSPAPMADRPLADPWLRLCARLLDSLVFGAAQVPLIAAVLWFVVRTLVADPQPDPDAATALMFAAFAAFAVLSWGGWLGYCLLTMRSGGQTWGKRVAGVRVVTLEGNRVPTVRDIVLRELVYLAMGSLYIDALWCLWDRPWQQCLHDKVAGTVVVPA
jgi:uncharacterized RDD family membrane protein YckC